MSPSSRWVCTREGGTLGTLWVSVPMLIPHLLSKLRLVYTFRCRGGMGQVDGNRSVPRSVGSVAPARRGAVWPRGGRYCLLRPTVSCGGCPRGQWHGRCALIAYVGAAQFECGFYVCPSVCPPVHRCELCMRVEPGGCEAWGLRSCGLSDTCRHGPGCSEGAGTSYDQCRGFLSVLTRPACLWQPQGEVGLGWARPPMYLFTPSYTVVVHTHAH